MNLLAGMLVGWVCAAVAALALKMNLPLPGRSRISSRRVHKYDAWSQWLAQANVHVTPVQFCAASLALGAAVYAVLSVVCGPVIALVPALAMGMVPRLYYGTSRRRRLTAAQRAWPDALRDVLTAVASGQTLHQGLLGLAQHGRGPLQTSFERYPALSRSMGSAAALEVVRNELADPVSDRVIEVMIIAAERGGGIVKVILEDLAASITADLRVLDEIDTEVLESRINARAVVVLPWVALVMLNQRGGPFRQFYTTSAGIAVVILGAILTVVGSCIIARLARVPVESRVIHSPVTT